MSDKLAGVHPRLVDAVTRLMFCLSELGHPIVVTDGLRTTAEQQALYAKGRTAPGAIVTNADGVRAKSNHQAKADGHGHAIDACFLKDGRPDWGEEHPWALYGLMAETLGLKWGGRWTRPDRPHVELP